MAKTANYQELKAELDSIMLELQREDLDVDEALKHYQRGLELVQALENYLKTAENKIKTLKASFNAES
jgi:exodeoxyribonuclease VII small subunit